MIQVIKDIIWGWQCKRAIKKANKLSELLGMKYYVIYMNGSLKVVPKRTIRELVAKHRFRKGVKVVSQASGEIRDNAELEACEEIAGYLRPKYDTEAVFSAEGEERNRLVVMYAADIALYHMIAAMPQKMGSEIRKERYERAVKWLEGVQAGKIIPDLPLATDEDGTPTGDLLIFGSQKQLRHNW